MNANLLSVESPLGIAVSGSDLFVTNFDKGTVGEYTTSGQIVNASLITGLGGFGTASAVAVSGTDLYVGNWSKGTIGKYTTPHLRRDDQCTSFLYPDWATGPLESSSPDRIFLLRPPAGESANIPRREKRLTRIS